MKNKELEKMLHHAKGNILFHDSLEKHFFRLCHITITLHQYLPAKSEAYEEEPVFPLNLT